MDWSFDVVHRFEGGPVYAIASADGEHLVAGGNSSDAAFAAWLGSHRSLAHPDSQGEHSWKRGLRRPWVRDGRVFMPGEWGLLAWSDDRGRSWTHVDTGVKACMYRVVEDPSGRLLAPNDDGVLGSDDGETWTWDHEGSRLLGVYFAGSRAIFYGAAVVIRERSEYRRVMTAPAPLCGMAATPSGVLILVGDGGQLYRSHDEGESWEKLAAPRGDLEDCIGTSNGVLVVGSRGTMMHTADDGDSWESIAHPWGSAHLWVLAPGDVPGEILLGGERGMVARIGSDASGGASDDLDDLD